MSITRRRLFQGFAATIAAASVPISKAAAYLPEPVRRRVDGWLRLEGQAVSRADYPELYRVIGKTYGEGGGTFSLPDLRGRFVKPMGSAPPNVDGETRPKNIELRYEIATDPDGTVPVGTMRATLHRLPDDAKTDVHGEQQQ